MVACRGGAAAEKGRAALSRPLGPGLASETDFVEVVALPACGALRDPPSRVHWHSPGGCGCDLWLHLWRTS